jgi:hypothetical protein
MLIESTSLQPTGHAEENGAAADAHGAAEHTLLSTAGTGPSLTKFRDPLRIPPLRKVGCITRSR